MEFSTVILFGIVVGIIAYTVIKKRKAFVKGKSTDVQSVEREDVITPYVSNRTVNRIHGVLIVDVPPMDGDIPFSDDAEIAVNEAVRQLTLEGRKPLSVNTFTTAHEGVMFYITY